MKIKSMDARMLASKLRVRLDEIGQPVSLDAAHALMVSHSDAIIRRQYHALERMVRTTNAKTFGETQNDAHSAVKYLISFLKTHRYDEKRGKVIRTSD
ncbi:hypothetical protein HY994_02090 [Candidatus Micrarchaeota archaeon]|nr:hypothetical protein [Candidatus Micrarchaeota archaeon]